MSWQIVQQLNWLVGFISQLHPIFKHCVSSVSQLGSSVCCGALPSEAVEKSRQAKQKQGSRNMQHAEKLGTEVGGQGKRVVETDDLWVLNPRTSQIC